MVSGPPSGALPARREQGWYTDPIDAARFRRWDGEAWTTLTYDGTLTHDRSSIQHLPLPTGLPAPETTPRRPSRGRWPRVLAAVAAAVLVIVLIANITTSGSGGGGTSIVVGGATGRVSAGGDAEQVSCIKDALTRDKQLVGQAIAESNDIEGLDVDHAWARLADQLRQLDLGDCPTSFRTAFIGYVEQIDRYGSVLEDRTGSAGMDDVFNGDSLDDVQREMTADINAAYDRVRSVSDESGVEAPRGSISITSD